MQRTGESPVLSVIKSQLNINKKRNDPTFTVHPAFKAPGGHFLLILYTIVRKICQTSLILS